MRKLAPAVAAALLVACGGGGGSGGPATTANTGGGAASSLPAGGGTQAPPAEAPNACSLLTDTEASSLLGGPAMHKANPSRDASNGSGVVVTEKGCHYTLITSDQSGHEIQVAVYAGADRQYFDGEAIRFGLPAIPGLGDAASGDAIHVFVFAKGTMLQIYGSLAPDDGLQQVARIAIAKL